MNQLIIKLTGTVDVSNFDEWKKDLIAQIQLTNIKLVTDNDFVVASNQVKAFRSAEKILKEAKQSAIDQAESIQNLFSAIDSIAAETRQTRLSLERQIKQRKLEIKDHCIQAGMMEIKNFIAAQADEFNYADHSVFLNTDRFKTEASHKRGVKELQSSIDRLCVRIKQEVSEKAAAISNNKIRIDALIEEHKLLFQDWKSLLVLSDDDLEREINKRIFRYNEKTTTKEAEEIIYESNTNENTELDYKEKHKQEIENASSEKYRIIVDIVATEDIAKEIAHSIKVDYGNHPSIHEIKLIRNRAK